MSFFDSLLERIRALFETTRAPEMATSDRLGSSSVGELAGALDELRGGEQGWIGFDDYVRLFAANMSGRAWEEAGGSTLPNSPPTIDATHLGNRRSGASISLKAFTRTASDINRLDSPWSESLTASEQTGSLPWQRVK
jgi:hypothetical protein